MKREKNNIEIKKEVSTDITQHSLLLFSTIFSVSVSYFIHILGPESISVLSLIAINTPGMSIWYVTKCLMCHTVYKRKERKPDVKESRSKTCLRSKQDERLYSTLLLPVFLWTLWSSSGVCPGLLYVVTLTNLASTCLWLHLHYIFDKQPRKTLSTLHLFANWIVIHLH